MSLDALANQLVIARRYLEEGEPDLAEISFEISLQIAPGNPEALTGLKQIVEQRREKLSAAGNPCTPSNPPPVAPWCTPKPNPSQPGKAPEQQRADARPPQPQADDKKASEEYRAATKAAVETANKCARDLIEAAEWALRQKQWTDALDWFDLAAAWSPEAHARAGRTEAARQILATRAADSTELLRVLSRWLKRDSAGPEVWQFAADVLDWFRIPNRALTARIRASVLRGESAGQRAAWEQDLAARQERTQGRPNIIFYNVTNAGASAIDPIFRKLLAEDFGYELIGTPGVSQFVEPLLDGPTPFYHWTHSGPEQFAQWLERDNCRFICLYRDPRDVLVSHALDPANAKYWGNKPTRQVIAELATTNFPKFFENTAAWLNVDPARLFAFSFEEMKRDIPAMVGRIFEFLGLPIDQARMQAACDEHSFERLAGRTRGSEGPVVRGAYLLRKGTSGQWPKHFDASLAATFLPHCGRYLIDWGYEPDHRWAEMLPEADPAPATPPAPVACLDRSQPFLLSAPPHRAKPAVAAPPRKAAEEATEFQVVSAPFASGVAWLINILLELDIRTTHVARQWPEYWQADGATERINPAALAHFRGILPVLHERQNFTFEPAVEVFWEHRLDFARHSHRPTLVFVRDPRDAIYSLYRRHYAANLSFIEYLGRPDVWPDHFPGMFHLPPAETWAAWHAFWLGMATVMNVKFVRFETMRANPLENVREVLAFLGVSRTEADIERALAGSSFERARAAMEQCAGPGGRPFQTARRGKVGEWKETYGAGALRYFAGPANHVMRTLGYEAITDDALDLKNGETDTARDRPVSEHLLQADELRKTGHLDHAQALLQEAISRAGEHRLPVLHAASALAALDWTQKVFGRDMATSAVSHAAYDAWREFNEQFLDWLPIQQMLLAAYGKAKPPRTETPPQLIEQGFRGFNLVRYAGKIFALAQSLGPFDLVGASEEVLLKHQADGRVFVADFLTEVKQRIEQRSP